EEERRQKVEERQKLAESRGFTAAYQQEQENRENVVSRPKRAPATDVSYARAVENWYL
ncbi:hypothetical protein BA78_8845, partial [Aspergillus fumigatus]